MLKNHTLKNSRSRIGLYGSAPPPRFKDDFKAANAFIASISFERSMFNITHSASQTYVWHSSKWNFAGRQSAWWIRKQILSTKDYHSVPGIITQYQGLLLSTMDYYLVPGIIRISQPDNICKLSVSRHVNHTQHYKLLVMPETKEMDIMVQVLLDFKANWRDHFYFRHLTRVIKDD